MLTCIRIRGAVLSQTLPDELTRNEASWKLWYAENEPEGVPVPCFEGRLAADPSVGAFYRLLLIRLRVPSYFCVVFKSFVICFLCVAINIEQPFEALSS